MDAWGGSWAACWGGAWGFEVAPGVGPGGKKTRRFVVVRDGRIVLTTSVAEAIAAAGKSARAKPVEIEPEVAEVVERAIEPETAEISLEAIRRQASAYQQERELMALFRQRRLARAMAVYAELLRRIDEDEQDAELLLLMA